jgi:hypothetical protein
VALLRLGETSWEPLPATAGYVDAGRGYGLVDLALTPVGTEPRAGGLLALHVLDVMASLLTAATETRPVAVGSSADQPAPVPLIDLTAG